MASTQGELRIVLIGKTGNGKSSTGNSLLHSRTAFHSAQSAKSITRNCEAKTNYVMDINGQQKKLIVVDTPGFFDTNSTITNTMVEQTITSQIFNMTSPGVHAFLIILRIGRFTAEEKDTVDFIKTIFGPGAAQYCIIVFTREDELDEGQNIDDFIKSSSPLQELVNICGNRKLAINNKLNGRQLEKKTKKLLQMIDQTVTKNNGQCYTNEIYKRIEQQRKEEQIRREQEELARKKAYEEALLAQTRAEERRRAEIREREAREEERRIAERQAQMIREEERRKAEKREQELREEERRKAEKREQELREEARRRAEAERREQEERERRRAQEEAQRKAEAERREQEERERRRAQEEARLQQSYRRNNDCNYDSVLSAMQRMLLSGPTFAPSASMCVPSDPPRSMNCGMGGPMFTPSVGGSMTFDQPRSVNYTMGGGHGGRFTGETMSTRGSANGRAIWEGSRGGLYYTNSNGNKTYLRR